MKDKLTTEEKIKKMRFERAKEEAQELIRKRKKREEEEAAEAYWNQPLDTKDRDQEKIMKNKTYLIQSEDRYGRSDEFELKATSKANAEEIANWHWNVINGSVIINVIEL